MNFTETCIKNQVYGNIILTSKINSCIKFNLLLLICSACFITNAASVDDDRRNVFQKKSFEKENADRDRDPKILSEGYLEIPLKKLFKSGVDGNVVVEMEIDEKGNVERCSIRKGINPELDTAVSHAMKNTVFSPAISEGEAVPARITMDYAFEKTAMIAKSATEQPDIRGIVIDRLTARPVQNAHVNLEVVDTMADSGLLIPFGSYLAVIGTVQGQSVQNRILSTTGDSAGCFAFRFLPDGLVRLAVMAPGYESKHLQLKVEDGKCKVATIPLDAIRQSADMEIVVYGVSESKPDINVEVAMVKTGITRYLSDIIRNQTVVRSVPESKSVMMVRSGSPYDNRYFIYGIPFLAPFHFGGHAYADVDGLMISALNECKLTINGICGKQTDVSGFRIDMQPGLFQQVSRKKLHVPELSVDYNTSAQDFMLMIPRRRSDAAVQIGYTRAEGGNEKEEVLVLNNKYSSNEYGRPVDFGNATFTGSLSVGSIQLNTFSWFAWDSYMIDVDNMYIKETIPWGMSAFSLASTDKRIPRVYVGGSHQYFADAIKVASDTWKKMTVLSNGNMVLSYDTANIGTIKAGLDIQIEYMNWKGNVGRWVKGGNIQDVNMVSSGKTGETPDSSVRNAFYASGREWKFQVHGNFRKNAGKIYTSLDLLGAGVKYEEDFKLIGDAGIEFGLHQDWLNICLNAGRVTSRPDIRGLPETDYREKQFSSYIAALPVTMNNGTAKLSLQPYFRVKSHEPWLEPVELRWIPSEATRLWATGIDIEWEKMFNKWLTFNHFVNISKAKRVASGGDLPYEWDVPWASRECLHLTFGGESEFHIYINGVVAKGMLFNDIFNERYIKSPMYNRVDVGIQYRNKFVVHRYLTRYDAYLNAFNLTYIDNASDYFWDNNYQPMEIPQMPLFFEIGIRVAARL